VLDAQQQSPSFPCPFQSKTHISMAKKKKKSQQAQDKGEGIFHHKV
jgi:hypothetical protein